MVKKKILMILSKPFILDPRVYSEAKTLVELGNEVMVIVWDRKGKYEKVSVVEGIKIIRVHNEGLMKFLKINLFRNPLWWIKAYREGLELYKSFKFDIVHCHDLDTLYAGFKLKKKLGVKLIYDAHELWGYLIEGEVPKIIVKATFLIEKKLVKKVDHIITVSQPFLKYFSSIAKCPITILMNCKELKNKNYDPTTNKKFTLIYIGGMKRKRLFPDIIDLCTKIDNIHLILAGKVEDMFYEIMEYSKKFNNVEFLGTILTEEILPLTKKSDATFIIVDPKSKHYQRTLFNKQFEAMVCGRPIIVTKGTYAAEMTEDLNCGLTVYYDIESVREAIIKLRDNPSLCKELGENALKAAVDKYNWNDEKNNLIKVYEEIL
jgi:glycosyltransferase involved in cell wall biosynthesis